MRRRLLTGTLLLLTLPAAAARPDPAPLVARAWAEWSACGENCKGESGLGAELWNLRRRLADRDTLISMAVAVEQGEEACLCGKTNPTATDVERQGLLIAEAILLWHLADNAEGVRHNTQRLRNVVARSAGQPYEPALTAVLLRLVALTGGDARPEDTANPDGYGPQAVREAAILIEPARSVALTAAARSAALPEPARQALYAATEPPSPDEPTPPPASISLPPNHPITARLDPLLALVHSPEALARSLAALPAEQHVWTAQQIGRRLPNVLRDARDILGVADALPQGPVRIALLVGAAQSLTHAHPRARYEDLLLVRPATASRPPTP